MKITNLLRKLFDYDLHTFIKLLLGVLLLFLDRVYDARIRSSLPFEQPVNLIKNDKVLFFIHN